MSKDWRKVIREEFSDETGLLNKISQVDLIDFIDELLDKHLSTAVAKERTQLLKEVREKVIGNERWFMEILESRLVNDDDNVLGKVYRVYERVTLEKLKELEKEGKE